jgi:hypothetical protein
MGCLYLLEMLNDMDMNAVVLHGQCLMLMHMHTTETLEGKV